jgi:nucleotide-binding universal stress UspA family protein
MKILFATDDSKFSEAAAKSLAQQFRPQDTEVRVLHVVEPITSSAPPQMSLGYYPELEDRLPQAREVAERAAKTGYSDRKASIGSRNAAFLAG